jgi:hypothetical protein
MELFEREWNAFLFNFLTTVVKNAYNTDIRYSVYQRRTKIQDMEIKMEYQKYGSNVPVAYSIRKTPSFFQLLSKHPNLTMETILKHPYNIWDWSEISANPAITMDDVEKHLEKPWNLDRLSENPNMTATFWRKYPNFNWNLEKIALNPFLGDKRQFLDYKVKNTFIASIHEHINDVANYKTTPVCKCSIVELVFADIYIVMMIAKN